jgi:hypothetical protein
MLIIPQVIANPRGTVSPELSRLAKLFSPYNGNITEVSARDLRDCAKAYQFDADARDIALRMMEGNPKHVQSVMAMCRPPNRIAYMELPHKNRIETVGILTEGDRGGATVTLFQTFDRGAWAAPTMTFWLDCDDYVNSRPNPYCFGNNLTREQIAQNFVAGSKYVVCLWAFLNIEGVATLTEKLTGEGKKARRRGRFVDCPVNVYKKVTLNRKHPEERSGSYEGGGVAYHNVIGHWSRYHTKAEGVVWNHRGVLPRRSRARNRGQALRTQVDQNGTLIAATPKYFVVPPQLETLAEKTISQVQATQTSNVNTFTFLELLVESRLTDAKAYYLCADPNLIDGITYAYLQGLEGPQLRTEIGFNTAGISYRIEEDFACAVTECRGLYKNPGA